MPDSDTLTTLDCDSNQLTYVDLSDHSASKLTSLYLEYLSVPVTLTNDGKGTYSASIRIGGLTDPPYGVEYTLVDGETMGMLTVTDTSITELKFSTPTGLQISDDFQYPYAYTPVSGILQLTYEGENNPPADGNDPPTDNANVGDNNLSDGDEKPRQSAPSGGSSGGGGGGGGSTEPSPSPSPSPSASPEPAPAPEPAPDEQTNPYIDVHESDWFYSDVLAVTFAGLMKGKNTTYTYCPSDDLTRAEWVMILARLSNAPAANAVSEPWYQAVWDRAIAEGITDGTNPTFPITREQLVTILWRYYVGGGVPDAPQNRNISGYTDSAQISRAGERKVASIRERTKWCCHKKSMRASGSSLNLCRREVLEGL